MNLETTIAVYAGNVRLSYGMIIAQSHILLTITFISMIFFKEDDHVDVLKKLEADMGRLIDLFCKIETFHDFTGIDIGYYKDNEKELEEYSKNPSVIVGNVHIIILWISTMSA